MTTQRKRKLISFTLNPKTIELLKQASENEDVKMSRIIENLIKEKYFKKN